MVELLYDGRVVARGTHAEIQSALAGTEVVQSVTASSFYIKDPEGGPVMIHVSIENVLMIDEARSDDFGV